MEKIKKTLDILPFSSMSALSDYVTRNNHENPNNMILKEDIVDITKDDDTVFLIYYK